MSCKKDATFFGEYNFTEALDRKQVEEVGYLKTTSTLNQHMFFLLDLKPELISFVWIQFGMQFRQVPGA